ncbi:MAG: hypothetical protein HRT56_08325, partial [Coraliomargarita sp.]|nr:hypothetical protein [Coraliomargarita sp.]
TVSLLITDGSVRVNYAKMDGSSEITETQPLLHPSLTLESLRFLSAGTTTAKEGIYVDAIEIVTVP